jgi:hypothetical protein
MNQDEFTKLFKYMTERFDKVDEQFAAQNLQFDRLQSLIDQVLKKQEISEDERLVMGHQIDRLDRWVHELADKIGFNLTA